MFNRRTGEIMFPSFSISEHISLDSILNLLPPQEIVTCSKSNGRANVYLAPQKVGDEFFVLRLFFEGVGMHLVRLTLSVQKNSMVPSWENWTEEKQLSIKAENDAWLEAELGKKPYDYPWGSVKSVYNSCEGSSYIVVIYK